jgi:hypothetical protein
MSLWKKITAFFSTTEAPVVVKTKDCSKQISEG